MRSRKSHHVRESVDSEDSDKSADNSSASDDTDLSSEDEINKKSKKRKKRSSSSESDSAESYRRRSKKKKHKKKKRKHSKKKRHHSTDDEESDTNEEVSSDAGDISPPKKKRKRKHKQKHSKKKGSKSTNVKVYSDKFESQEETHSKHVSLSEEEITLSSEDGRQVHLSHRVEQQPYKYHTERSRHTAETSEVTRFYRGTSKDHIRRGEISMNNRYVKETDVNDHRDRYSRIQHERVEAPGRYDHYAGQIPRLDVQESSYRYKDKKLDYGEGNYEAKYDKRNNRNQNYNRYNNNNNSSNSFRARDDNAKYNRYPETNQNRHGEQRYQREKEDIHYKKEINNRDYAKPDYRDNRFVPTDKRDYHYQKRNEIKSLMPDKYSSDSKPGTSGGQNRRHYRNEQPAMDQLDLPREREETRSSHPNEKNYGRYERRENRRDKSYDRADGMDEKDDKLFDKGDRQYERSDKPNHKDNRNSSRSEKNDRNDKYDDKDDERKSDKSSFKDRRPDRRRRDDKDEETKKYDWGKKSDEVDVKKEKMDKEEPNFALSGKLTEDANLVNGVVLKYTPPDDAKQPKRRWRFYPFKGDKALPTLYIHRQDFFLLGRDRRVADIPLDHPSVSKQHAVLQYRMVAFTKENGTTGRKVRPYIIDLESANGTFVNNKKIEARKFIELLERDVVKFGFSQREYVLLHENSKDGSMDDDDVQPGADQNDLGVKKESNK